MQALFCGSRCISCLLLKMRILRWEYLYRWGVKIVKRFIYFSHLLWAINEAFLLPLKVRSNTSARAWICKSTFIHLKVNNATYAFGLLIGRYLGSTKISKLIQSIIKNFDFQYDSNQVISRTLGCLMIKFCLFTETVLIEELRVKENTLFA